MTRFRTVSRAFDVLREEGPGRFVQEMGSYFNSKVSTLSYFLRQHAWRVKYGDVAPTTTDLIMIDPADINRMVTGHRPFSSRYTAIVGGEWDRRPIEIEFASERELRQQVEGAGVADLEQYAFFTSVFEHFEDGVPWEQTEFYQYKSRSNEGGHYGTAEKLHQRFAELDRLHDFMREEGYKSQRKLQLMDPEEVPFDTDSSNPERNEVAVAIGRDGEILHVDGRHRLAIAKLLGIEEMPVRVVCRHAGWHSLRAEVAAANTPADVVSNARTILRHPDIVDLPNECD